jgi:pyroglutamyl-peptidase
MPKVLLTAFEPYDIWKENASWLALVELTKDMPPGIDITTRRYPVDFAAVKERLAADLAAVYDYAIHLGQAPGSAVVQLEQFGINVGGHSSQQRHEHRPLASDGPAAYRSALPLAQWVPLLRGAGIPAVLSYYAGTYLCNATLYWTHYLTERSGWRTQAAFVHLPLATSQVAAEQQALASLSTDMAARAVRLILEQLAA